MAWAALGAAAAVDAREYRIPNRILFLGMAGGFLDRLLAAGEAGELEAWAAAAGFLLRAAVVTAGAFPFFAAGMAGGGDVKMMAFLAAWMGLKKGALAVGIGFVLGAVLALWKMLHHGSICQRFLYLAAYIRRLIQEKEITLYSEAGRDGRSCVIPLGTCFCAGAFVVGIWGRSMG